ncbi:MAG: DegV family protein, partial [Actinomycetota bacterium]
FLGRGGRLAGAGAAGSESLRIRPVLTLADGNAQLVARSRTRSRGVEEVLARTAGPAEAAIVIHSGAPEVDEVAARVEAACGVAPLIVLVGPAIGAHLGPRAIGVAVLAPKSAAGGQ